MFRMLDILMIFRYCFIVFCLRQSKLELRGESWVLQSVDHSTWWYCYKRPDFTDSFRFHVTEGTLQSHWKGISSQELEMAYEYKLLAISSYLKCPKSDTWCFFPLGLPHFCPTWTSRWREFYEMGGTCRSSTTLPES